MQKSISVSLLVIYCLFIEKLKKKEEQQNEIKNLILVYDFEIIKVFFSLSLSLYHYNVWEFLPLKIKMRFELRVTQKRENKKIFFFPLFSIFSIYLIVIKKTVCTLTTPSFLIHNCLLLSMKAIVGDE